MRYNVLCIYFSDMSVPKQLIQPRWMMRVLWQWRWFVWWRRHFHILSSKCIYLILHLVNEIALRGTLHARWMFFLEHFMKTLKGFLRQNAKLNGSMAEGWLIQESLVHISEFLVYVVRSLPQMWRDEDIRMTSIVP